MLPQDEIVKNKIESYIRCLGGSFNSWNVGITDDPRRRLFSEHGVIENKDNYIFEEASSHEAASEIETYFVNTLGTDGGTGGGDYLTTFVYAYLKRKHTKQ